MYIIKHTYSSSLGMVWYKYAPCRNHDHMNRFNHRNGQSCSVRTNCGLFPVKWHSALLWS